MRRTIQVIVMLQEKPKSNVGELLFEYDYIWMHVLPDKMYQRQRSSAVLKGSRNSDRNIRIDTQARLYYKSEVSGIIPGWESLGFALNWAIQDQNATLLSNCFTISNLSNAFVYAAAGTNTFNSHPGFVAQQEYQTECNAASPVYQNQLKEISRWFLKADKKSRLWYSIIRHFSKIPGPLRPVATCSDAKTHAQHTTLMFHTLTSYSLACFIPKYLNTYENNCSCDNFNSLFSPSFPDRFRGWYWLDSCFVVARQTATQCHSPNILSFDRCNDREFNRAVQPSSRVFSFQTPCKTSTRMGSWRIALINCKLRLCNALKLLSQDPVEPLKQMLLTSQVIVRRKYMEWYWGSMTRLQRAARHSKRETFVSQHGRLMEREQRKQLSDRQRCFCNHCHPWPCSPWQFTTSLLTVRFFTLLDIEQA